MQREICLAVVSEPKNKNIPAKSTSSKIMSDWVDIGYNLELPHHQVKAIRQEPIFPELADKASAMLFTVRSNRGYLFLHDVVIALHDSGNFDITNNVEKKILTDPKDGQI